MALPFKKFKTKQDNVKPVKNVTASQASHDFVKASKEFERSRIGDIEHSRSIAWKVAGASMACFILSAIALMALAPLKQTVPYVVRVDNNTGATDIVTTLTDAKTNYDEATAKFFAANYVRLMEGYDWYTIQNQVNQLMMFSDSNMQNQIKNKFALPNAPQKIYKDTQRVNVKINNVSLIDENNLAQVRFTTTVEPMGGGSYNPSTNSINPAPIVKNHIATLGYEYVSVPAVDDVRLVNPLGFTVKTYRVDDDSSVARPTPTANQVVNRAVQPTVVVTPNTPVTVKQSTTTTTTASGVK